MSELTLLAKWKVPGEDQRAGWQEMLQALWGTCKGLVVISWHKWTHGQRAPTPQRDSTVSWGLLVNANSWAWLHLLCWKSCLLRKVKCCSKWIMQGEMAIWGGDMFSRYRGSAAERQAGTDLRGRWTSGKIISNTQRKRKKRTKQFSG